MLHVFRLTCLLSLTLAGAFQAADPADAVTELLDADRGFSAAGAKLSASDSIAAMFADDIMMPTPRGAFAQGRAQAVEELGPGRMNLAGRAEWAPIRGGISADAQHGFTFGYMTLRRPDGGIEPRKYLAYWVRRPGGWRVAAYKLRPRPQGPVETTMMAPSLPEKIVAPAQDASRFAESLKQAESDFSAEANRIGLREAFARFGSADAINMGGPDNAAFVVGAEAIARTVGQGVAPGTSPYIWGADRVVVASSGDLGITFGLIHSSDPAAKGRPGIPFFTIWRRADPSQPWRYIAE